MREIISGNPDTRAVTGVSSEWLADHLDDSALNDCGLPAEQPFPYPGTYPWGLSTCRKNCCECISENFRLFPVTWISPEVAQVLFSTLGFEQDRPVVVYSGTRALTPSSTATSDGLEQTLVAYSLTRYECHKVMVLDGGFAKRKSENRKLTQDFGTSRLSPFTVDVQIDFLVGYDECVQLKDEPDALLLDTRPSSLYGGQGPWMKTGHIPGAVNLPATRVMDEKNSTLLTPEKEIRKILFSCGITPDKTVICSCGTGRTATAIFLVLKYYLGYPDVLMDEGGFTEWSSIPDNPVVVGKYPR